MQKLSRFWEDKMRIILNLFSKILRWCFFGGVEKVYNYSTRFFCYLVLVFEFWWSAYLFSLNIGILIDKFKHCMLHKIGILLSKLFWPTVRKNHSSDWEKLLKFEAEGREFAKILRSLEQFIQTVKGQNNFW